MKEYLQPATAREYLKDSRCSWWTATRGMLSLIMGSSWWKQCILRQMNGDFGVSGTASELGSVPDCSADALPCSLLPLTYKREGNSAPFCQRCWRVIWLKHLKCEYWDRQQNCFVYLTMVTVVVPCMSRHTEKVVQHSSRERSCLFTFCTLDGIESSSERRLPFPGVYQARLMFGVQGKMNRERESTSER